MHHDDSGCLSNVVAVHDGRVAGPVEHKSPSLTTREVSKHILSVIITHVLQENE